MEHQQSIRYTKFEKEKHVPADNASIFNILGLDGEVLWVAWDLLSLAVVTLTRRSHLSSSAEKLLPASPKTLPRSVNSQASTAFIGPDVKRLQQLMVGHKLLSASDLNQSKGWGCFGPLTRKAFQQLLTNLGLEAQGQTLPTPQLLKQVFEKLNSTANGSSRYDDFLSHSKVVRLPSSNISFAVANSLEKPANLNSGTAALVFEVNKKVPPGDQIPLTYGGSEKKPVTSKVLKLWLEMSGKVRHWKSVAYPGEALKTASGPVIFVTDGPSPRASLLTNAKNTALTFNQVTPADAKAGKCWFHSDAI